MKNIIIVPAKKHSSRLPDKNWKTINGEFLFELALDRALESGLGKVVFVSDDMGMVRVAAKKEINYITIIHKRQAEGRALDVCLWMLEEYFSKETFDNVIVTLPTAPFVTADDMKGAYEKFIRNDRRTLASFTTISGRPDLWSFFPYQSSTPDSLVRLNEKVIFRDNGGVYIDQVNNFIERREWFGDSVVAYIMDEIRGIDIDTKWDYLKVDAFSKKMGKC